MPNTLSALDAALDLLNPTITKVLWAAMLSMVHDVHCAQDNLKDEEWAIAGRVYDAINARIESSNDV